MPGVRPTVTSPYHSSRADTDHRLRIVGLARALVRQIGEDVVLPTLATALLGALRDEIDQLSTEGELGGIVVW